MKSHVVLREYYRKTSGFTLIELLVVIAVIALLLAIITPALGKAKEAAKRVICGSNQKSLGTLTMTFAEENDDKLMPLRYSGETLKHNHWSRYFYTDESGSGQGVPVERLASTYRNFGVLWEQGLVDSGEVFYCPSKDNIWRYEDYSSPAFPTPYAVAAGSSVAIRSSYSFNPECMSLKNGDVNDRQRRYTKRSQLHATSLLGLDVIGYQGAPHAGGWNLLHGDGSASYFRDSDLKRFIKEIYLGEKVPEDQPWRCSLTDQNYTDWDNIIRQLKAH